ncbi:hypothetical protein BKA65DRAFT_106158 [Rhexocercosporidium sp. MPI-PUGE-AT-0058]|nr:hypothetical protein BKA65DRAFT_106158 [Rhexocercosporidium sp. MPI-PUGE-AT-0058]
MAPSYRNANRRQNRPGVDHGEYEGIPIRHWRRDFVTVAPPPTPDSTTSQNDIWAVELPHGMPKDFHLLPQHSQDLLRAARSGKIYKRPAPADEEEADPEIIIGDKPEKKDEDLKEKGFTAKSWKQVARHLEGPDVVYLAKRRKGLVTATSKPLPIPTVTKATVKRIDAAGNEYVQDVVVPQGQVPEGEVISQTQIPDPNAPVGLAAVQATPPRPRPKSKKKAKGPGRGRKKKPAAPTSAPQVPLPEGVTPVPAPNGTVGPDGVKVETEPTSTPVHNEDTEMGDGSAANSDDDDGEDGEDGDEGDEDEGSVDVQDSPSKPSQPSPSAASIPILPPIPSLDQGDVPMGGTEFPHAPPRLLTERFEAKSGSPLKNVIMTTSTITSPLEPPAISSPTKAFLDTHPLASSETPSEAMMESLDDEVQQEISVLSTEALPPPPPEPTIVEAVAAVEERVAEEDEEKMLLDILDSEKKIAVAAPPEEEEEEEMLSDILDRAKNAEVGAPVEEGGQEEILLDILDRGGNDQAAASAIPAHRSPDVEAEIVQSDQTPQIEDAQSTPQPDVLPEPVQSMAASPETKEPPVEQEIIPNPPPAAIQDPILEVAPEPSIEAAPTGPTQELPVEDDDDYDAYTDLLGGLEKSLKTPEPRVETPIAVPVSEKTPAVEEVKDVDVTSVEVVEVSQESKAAEEGISEDEPKSQDALDVAVMDTLT